MGFLNKRQVVNTEPEAPPENDWYKYNCMEGVPEVEEDDDEYFDDSVFDDEPEGHPFRLILISLVLLAVSAYALYWCYNKYNDTFGVYYNARDSETVNKAYLEIANNLIEDSENCIVTPMGIDIAVTQNAIESDISYTEKRVLTNQFGRAYQSWEGSQALFEEYTNDSMVHVFNVSDDINTQISNIIGTEYELEEDMLDADKVAVVNLNCQFKERTCKTLTELFYDGSYFKNEAAFRLFLSDNEHELIIYRDEFPTEDWEHIKGVLSIPLDTFTFTSSMKHNISGLQDDEEISTKVVQIVRFAMDSGTYTEESPDYTHRVGTPYKVALRNRETGVIVASGIISGSTGE